MMDLSLHVFRDECRKYREYLGQRDELLKKLYLMQVQINGVHSIDTAKPRMEGKAEKSVLVKIEAKDQILQKLDEVNRQICFIESTISEIDIPYYRTVVWEKFVMNKSYKTISDQYGVDMENLRKRVTKSLLISLRNANADSAGTLKK